MRLAGLWAALLAATALTAATAQERPQTSLAPLGEAIRAVLIASPDLLSGLTATPRLFDPDRPGIGPADAPTRIAFFTRAGCADCATARAELQALAERMGFRATEFDMGRDAALARDLGLDMAPSYILPDKMLRGAMPAIVLERYLGD